MQHKESTILQISKETAQAPLKKDLELTFGRFFFKFRPVFSAFLFAAHLFFEFLEKKKGNITQHIQLLIQFTVILQADCGFVNSPLRLAYPHL